MNTEWQKIRQMLRGECEIDEELLEKIAADAELEKEFAEILAEEEEFQKQDCQELFLPEKKDLYAYLKGEVSAPMQERIETLTGYAQEQKPHLVYLNMPDGSEILKDLRTGKTLREKKVSVASLPSSFMRKSGKSSSREEQEAETVKKEHPSRRFSLDNGDLLVFQKQEQGYDVKFFLKSDRLQQLLPEGEDLKKSQLFLQDSQGQEVARVKSTSEQKKTVRRGDFKNLLPGNYHLYLQSKNQHVIFVMQFSIAG